MAWQSLVIEVAGDIAERLSDALMAAGAMSVAVEDARVGTAEEHPRYGEPTLDQTTDPWPNSRLSALFDAGVDVQQTLSFATQACGLPAMHAGPIGTVEDIDWVRHTQSQFDPIHVTERIWIVPTWHATPDPQAINIVLDPGLAFGSGSHPTTQLCMAWLEQRIRPGMSVIDYGCGSGILAIAAAKLGADNILGVDIDPVAVLTARANAASNKVTGTFVDGNATITHQADLVVANILANPLKVLAPMFARLSGPGGRIVLSGLLIEQIAAVSACYEPYFAMSTFAVRDSWAAIEGIRR